MENRPMYMRFLNKFVLLFEATEDKETERQIEQLLKKLDSRPQFAGLIHSTCILGAAYTDPSEFGKSYQEAKNLIPKKDYLPNPTNKKCLVPVPWAFINICLTTEINRKYWTTVMTN